MVVKQITHEIKENSTVETRERRMEPTSALQKFTTMNPEMRFPAINRSIALIINVNNPNVRMLIGRVKRRRTGLINVFIRPIIMEATRAVVKSFTSMPVTILDTINNDKAFTNHRISTFIRTPSVSHF
jgi:hypothetical protein